MVGRSAPFCLHFGRTKHFRNWTNVERSPRPRRRPRESRVGYRRDEARICYKTTPTCMLNFAMTGRTLYRLGARVQKGP